MDKDSRCISEKILNLTLEIISLLTGEVYTIVKKTDEHLTSKFLSHTSARLNRKHDERILEVTQKIIELLTGEVPIRCQDVTVYFSMEEWEYLEGHKDLYKDISKNKSPCALSDCSNKELDQAEDWQSNGGSKMGLGSLKRFVEDNPDLYLNSDTSWIINDKLYSSEKKIETTAVKNKDLSLLNMTSSSAEGLELTGAVPVINGGNIVMFIKEESFLGDNDGYNDLRKITGPMEHNTGPPKNAYDLGRPEFPTVVGILPDFSNIKSEDHTEQLMRQKRSTEVGSPFSCAICDKSFACNSALETHNRVHTGEKPFSCKNCGKSFMKIAGLCAHEKVHNREWLFHCAECERSFSSKSHFLRHQIIHTRRVEFSGSEADRNAYNDSNFVACLNVQTLEEPNVYMEGETLGHQEDLTHLHRTFSAENSYSCSNCDKCFESRSALRAHRRTHRKKQQLPCTYCHKCFLYRSDLERHERTHTGEKPFSCSYCDKRFTNRFSVIIHERIHTGEKPYSCSVCGRCFNDLSSFVVHKRRHEIHMNVGGVGPHL